MSSRFRFLAPRDLIASECSARSTCSSVKSAGISPSLTVSTPLTQLPDPLVNSVYLRPPGRYLLLEDCMGNTPSVVWRRLPLTPRFEASHGMVRNHRNANRRCAVGRDTRSCQCGTLPCSIMKNAPPPRMAAVDTRSNNRGHHGRKKLKSQSVDVAPRRYLLKR